MILAFRIFHAGDIKMSRKSVLNFAAISFVLLGATPVFADDKTGFYVGAEAGWSWSQNTKFSDENPTNTVNTIGPNRSLNTSAGDSPLVGVKAGYRIHDMFRTDVSATYRGGYSVSASNAANGVSAYKADVTNWTAMLNGYVEPITLGKFKPYVGAGVGAAINSASNGVFNGGGANNKLDDRTQTNFAWQASVGTAYNLTEHVALDVGYRYLDAGKISIGGNSTLNDSRSKGDSLSASEVTAGIRYGF